MNSNEINLSAQYETLSADEMPKRAKEIFNKFISPDAPVMVNLEGSQVNVWVRNFLLKLPKALSKAIAHPSEQTFTRIKEKIYKILENEWFPDFVVSPLYHACNGKSFNMTWAHTDDRWDY